MTTFLNTTLGALAMTITMALASTVAHADKYQDAMNVFNEAGESGEYFKNSYGYALFPSIGKGGIGVGGAHGTGKVFEKGVEIGEASMTQLTVGFQLGGQVYSQVIFFENKEALDSFTSGNFEFGAQATAVAITAGVSAEANTGGGASTGISGGQNDASTKSAGYRKGMAVFTVAKGGLMYEATLGGQKYSFTPNK